MTFDAIYENGVLKPASPLPFKEHELLRVTVVPERSVARQSAGMLQWTGDAKTLHQLAEAPEFGISESS